MTVPNAISMLSQPAPRGIAGLRMAASMLAFHVEEEGGEEANGFLAQVLYLMNRFIDDPRLETEAVAAETERCARVAEERCEAMPTGWHNRFTASVAATNKACEEIAAAKRETKEDGNDAK